jgi:hypothetical protein
LHIHTETDASCYLRTEDGTQGYKNWQCYLHMCRACLLLHAAGVTIEQIKADADKSAVAAQAVLSQEAEPLSNQWTASDPMQSDKN